MLTKASENKGSLASSQSDNLELFWFILDDCFSLLIVDGHSGDIHYVNKNFYSYLELSKREPLKNLKQLLCQEEGYESISNLLKSAALGQHQKKTLCLDGNNGKTISVVGNFYKWIDKENQPQVLIIFANNPIATPLNSMKEPISLWNFIGSEIETTFILLKKINDLAQNISFPLGETPNATVLEVQKQSQVVLGKLSTVRSCLDLQKHALHETPAPTSIRNLLEDCKSKYSEFLPSCSDFLSINVAQEIPESVITIPITISRLLQLILEGLINFRKTGNVQLIVNKGMVKENNMPLSLLIIAQFDPEDELKDSYRNREQERFKEILHIARELIQLRNGKVLLETAAKESFYFHFSIDALMPNEINSAIAPKHPMSEPNVRTFPENTRVLAAVDVELNQLIMKQQFSNSGIITQFVQSGHSVLKILQNQAFDLIITDLQMSDMNGLKVVEAIRNSHVARIADIPIISIGTSSSSEAKELYLTLGADAFLPKPYQINELKTLMIPLVEDYRFRQPLFDEPAIKNNNIKMEKYFDLTNLEEISEGDKEFSYTMISYFVDHTPSALENLISRVAAQDWTEVRLIAHKLKPQLMYMGIHSIQQDVELMEQYANQQINLDQIPAMAAKTEKYCNLAIEQLREELKRMEK